MSKGDNRQYERRVIRKRLNRSQDPSSHVAHGYGNIAYFSEVRSEFNR